MNIDLLPRPERSVWPRRVFRVSLPLVLGMGSVLLSVVGHSAQQRAEAFSAAARAAQSELPGLAARVDGAGSAAQEARKAREVAVYLLQRPDAAQVALRFLKDLPRTSTVEGLNATDRGLSANVAASGFAGVAGIVRGLEGDPLFASVTVSSVQKGSGGPGRGVVAAIQLSLRSGSGFQP